MRIETTKPDAGSSHPCLMNRAQHNTCTLQVAKFGSRTLQYTSQHSTRFHTVHISNTRHNSKYSTQFQDTTHFSSHRIVPTQCTIPNTVHSSTQSTFQKHLLLVQTFISNRIFHFHTNLYSKSKTFYIRIKYFCFKSKHFIFESNTLFQIKTFYFRIEHFG